jgi:hypothetical protein
MGRHKTPRTPKPGSSLRVFCAGWALLD